jgi:hypothetical protein
MTFFISNNTTYNYSYYATRPKWLIESLLKESLSQKEYETNPSHSKKSTPINKVAFTPWPQKLKNQNNNVKQQNTNLSHLKTKSSRAVRVIQIQTKNQTISLQKLKHKLSVTRLKTTNTHSKKARRRLFQTKELLCWASDLSFFNLRGYFSNILKVLQICRFAVRNNQKILFVKSSSSSYGQGKALSPWLVQYKRNTVPITLSNLFNKSYLNPAQPLVSPQILYLKNNKETNQGKKGLHRIINIPKYSLLRQEKPRKEPVPNTFVKNSLKANLLEKHSNRLEEINTPKNKQSDYSTSNNYSRSYYKLNNILNDYLNTDFGDNYSNKTSHFKNSFLFSSHFKTQKTVSKPWGSHFSFKESLSKIENKQKKTTLFVNLYLKSLNDVSQGQSLKNKNQYKRISRKATIRIDNIIKLWVKEAQIISQQTAVGLTIPLAGFLTNSKTTFNTIYNLSNDDAYNSISSNLKSNSLLNKGAYKIKTNRLENIHFQKKCHQFPQALPKHLQDKDSRPLRSGQSLALPFTLWPLANGANATTRIKKNNNRLKTKNSIKNSRYRIRQKLISGGQQNGLEMLAFSFPRILKSWKLRTTREVEKDKKKQFIQYKNSNVDIPPNLKNKKTQDFRQKAWWANYYNSHNYLALASNTRSNDLFKDSEFITYSEKSKKPRPLEYCFFGDVFTWQPKSQKSSSMFYSNSSFSKNKENISFYLKKQVILEKRGPIIFKKKKQPFFTHFKKQLQGFKSPTLQLKEPFSYITHNPWQRKTKNCFLRKKQLLSTLAQFIVFYLNEGSILLKNQTKWAKKEKTYINLPSFSTIKRTVKLHLNSRNFEKYAYKPTYRYTIAFHTLQRILNQPNRIKVLGPLPLSKKTKTEENMPRKREFFKTFDQGRQKNKKRSQKRLSLRPFLFYKYYKTIIALNHFNQYKMFAKTPFVNNRLADIIFFINPEKNQNLVNQANCLKIPTVGIISGNMVSAQSHQGYDNFRLKDSVYYPILGNPISNFFTRAIISLIVKFLRVEKSKKKWSHR